MFGQNVSAVHNAVAATPDFPDDIAVLNFALNLAYFEAEFYRQGNAAGLLSGQEAQYLRTIASDEEKHISVLSQTVTKWGGTPIDRPKVSFPNLFLSRKSYLTASHTFENTSVSAYLGSVNFLKNRDIRQIAVGIYGVEARHAAIVGDLLDLAPDTGVYPGALEKPMTKQQVLTAVTPFWMSQMTTVPVGSADTGGGSASARSETGLYAVAGAVLAGAAGTAAYAMAHRADRGSAAEAPVGPLSS